MKKVITLLLICTIYNAASQESLKTKLEQAIQDYSEFSGSVLILKNEVEVLKSHSGLSDSVSLIKNSDNTQYGLASLSKLYTMLGILKLVDQNKLSLEDSLGSFLRGFDDPRAKSVTVQHLLSHRSGWEHYWSNAQYIQAVDSLKTHEDFLTFIQKIPLDFEPGTDYQYSNIGYILLGIVIERVSGQDYYTFIQEQVLNPLELSSTSFGRDSSNRAIPYSQSDSKPVKTSQAWADGGASSTILDLQKVVEKVFVQQSFLSPKSLSELMDGFNEENDGIFELQGGFPGTSTSLLFHAPTGYSIIVLANQDPPIAENVSISIIQILLDYIANTESISLSGTTTDIKTGEVIPYVNIGIAGQGVGTASNQNGKYQLEIPKEYASDTITFSAIGFKPIKKPITALLGDNQFNAFFEEVQQSLDEVIVFGQKPKKGTLGTGILSPLASGAYIGGGKPGASLVMLIEPPKSPTYIYRIRVHVRGNKKEKPFKLRLRILKEQNGRPDIDLLQKSMIVESTINSGWITFDFGDQPIELNEHVFVGLEWIEEPDNKVNARNAYPRVSYTANNNADSFARTTSLGQWKKIHIKPAIKVEVEF